MIVDWLNQIQVTSNLDLDITDYPVQKSAARNWYLARSFCFRKLSIEDNIECGNQLLF
jgi:hypothetical protein